MSQMPFARSPSAFALGSGVALLVVMALPAAAQAPVLDARAAEVVRIDLASMEAAVAVRSAVAFVLPGGARAVVRPAHTERRGPGPYVLRVEGGGSVQSLRLVRAR